MNGLSPTKSGERPSFVRYGVLAWLCTAAALAYVHRVCLGIAESTVRTDLGISEEWMGLAMGGFFYTYALCQIPTALLTDRWGPRRALCLFGTLGALTVALAALTWFLGPVAAFAVLLTSRLTMGVAQAGLFPASTKCIAVWFPLNRRSFATGTLTAFMSVGGAGGAIITGMLLAYLPWQVLFALFAVPGLIWSVGFFLWYRDKPEEHPSINAGELALLPPPAPSRAESGPTPWRTIFTSPQLFWLCSQQFCRAAATVFYLTWFSTFLQNAYGLNKVEAGELTSLPLLGVVAGALFGGTLSDWVLARTGSKRQSRRGVSVVSLALAVTCFCGTYAIDDPNLAVAAVTVAAFLASISSPCAYSVTIDIGGKQLAPIFGAMNMSGNFGSALFASVVPLWVRGTTLFGEADWRSVLFFVAGLYLAGLLLWLRLDPEREVLEDDRVTR